MNEQTKQAIRQAAIEVRALLNATEEHQSEAEELIAGEIMPLLDRQWQPIDTAPRDGTPIIVFSHRWHGKACEAFWDTIENDWEYIGFPGRRIEPEIWMLLPPAPNP